MQVNNSDGLYSAVQAYHTLEAKMIRVFACIPLLKVDTGAIRASNTLF